MNKYKLKLIFLSAATIMTLSIGATRLLSAAQANVTALTNGTGSILTIEPAINQQPVGNITP